MSSTGGRNAVSNGESVDQSADDASGAGRTMLSVENSTVVSSVEAEVL